MMTYFSYKGLIYISIAIGLASFVGLNYLRIHGGEQSYHVTYNFLMDGGASGFGSVRMVLNKPINSQEMIDQVTAWIKRDTGAKGVVILGWEKLREPK